LRAGHKRTFDNLLILRCTHLRDRFKFDSARLNTGDLVSFPFYAVEIRGLVYNYAAEAALFPLLEQRNEPNVHL
jgi:hypothetical protein